MASAGRALKLRVASTAALLLALAAACGSSGRHPGSGTTASGGSAGASGPTSLTPSGTAGENDDPECHRDVSLEAVKLGEPAPFDLIIVADHSGSLAWSRDALSAGLSQLLSNAEGRDVRVFILTPTQYGASSEAARQPLRDEPVVPWQDPETGKAYEDAATVYSQVCTSPEGAVIDCPSPLGPTPYHVQGTWSFQMPEPVALLRRDMSRAEFEAQQAGVREAILAIGGTGSPHEQPLCTLARYVSQDKSLLPQNAMFLVISDEDDVGTPSDCLVGFSGDVEVSRNESGTTACSADCDAYRYTMTGDLYSKGFPITCAAFDDLGNQIAGSEAMHYAYQGGVSSCAAIVAGPCSEAEKQTLEWVCGSDKQITSCHVECSTSSGAQCSVDLQDPQVDACSQSFTHQGQTYANLPAYCAARGSSSGSDWRDCQGGGVNISYTDSLTGGSSPQTLMPGNTTADVARYFRTTADAAFEPQAYMLEAIVFDPAFTCPLGTGQSYATNLVSLVADRSKIFPLCESYAPALDGVWNFAQALIQTEFSLDLEDDEGVTLVAVIDADGMERTLPGSAWTYDRDMKLLTVKREALRGTDDDLRVEITSDCRPVVK